MADAGFAMDFNRFFPKSLARMPIGRVDHRCHLRCQLT